MQSIVMFVFGLFMAYVGALFFVNRWFSATLASYGCDPRRGFIVFASTWNKVVYYAQWAVPGPNAYGADEVVCCIRGTDVPDFAQMLAYASQKIAEQAPKEAADVA